MIQRIIKKSEAFQVAKIYLRTDDRGMAIRLLLSLSVFIVTIVVVVVG